MAKKHRTKYTPEGRPVGTQPVSSTQVYPFQIMQMSAQFNDSSADFSSDLTTAVSRTPDVIAISEMNRFRQEISNIANNNGYKPVMDANVEEAFLVRKSTSITYKGYGKRKVLDQYGQPFQEPWHSARYVSWIKINFLGLVIYCHTQHWLAHIYQLPLFQLQHAKQSNAMGTVMKQHGAEEGAVAFFSGDLNWDKTYTTFNTANRPDIIFASYKMQDIYSELNVGQPATFTDGRTLDYVGRYIPDKKTVTGTRFKVWPQTNSDHRPMSAWYNLVIDPNGITFGYNNEGRPLTWTEEELENVENSPAYDPYPYESAGNVDFSDYMDDEVYLQQQVIEDSDYLRSTPVHFVLPPRVLNPLPGPPE